VTKTFQSGDTTVTALNAISVDLRSGECAALLGPSGAGKSTLLMIAGCLMEPSQGRIVVGGEVLFDSGTGQRRQGDDRAFRRKHIGFVFQKAHLIPFLTALENVQLAMEINDVRPAEARRRAQALLDELGVGERAGNLPRQLSGGQQQRVAVARALANEPSLILADEPTAALDAQRSRQVMSLFQTIAHARGACVIVVTHDHRALEHFDRILSLQDGQLSEQAAGSPGLGVPRHA
jgi:putative ABC transport system ATP-binding protein